MKKLVLAAVLAVSTMSTVSFAAKTNCQVLAEKASEIAAAQYPDEVVFLASPVWQDQLTQVCVLTKVYSLQRLSWESTQVNSVKMAEELKDSGMPGAGFASIITVRAAYEQVKDSIKGGAK